MKSGETKVWNVADTAGTPRTRALSAALRRARESTGWGVREVARKLGMSHTTISQWETGKRVPRLEDVAAMLATIGITGLRREEILGLARGAGDPNWLTRGGSLGIAGVIECERTAAEIIEWSPMVVPGVLQTADYARVIFGAHTGLSPSEVESRILMRLGRRPVITSNRGGRGPAAYTPLVGEWAVRQRVGTGSVFTEQLTHLLDCAASVPVRVVPIGDGWHPGLSGPFTMFNFADQPSIVFAEHHRASLFLYDEQLANDYKVAVDDMLQFALSPAESVELITEIRKRE